MRRKRGQHLRHCPKMEFGQKLVAISWAVTIVWISLSYALSFTDHNPNETVTVALVTESFGVTLAYFGYQGVLKTSRNKHGVDRDGVPFRMKEKLDAAGITTDDSRDASG